MVETYGNTKWLNKTKKNGEMKMKEIIRKEAMKKFDEYMQVCYGNMIVEQEEPKKEKNYTLYALASMNANIWRKDKK